MRMTIFLGIVTLILSVSTAIIIRRVILLNWIPNRYYPIIWVAGLFFVLLQIAGPVLYRTAPSALNRPFVLQWIAYITLGVFFTFLIWTLVSGILIKISTFFGHTDSMSLERRLFLVSAFLTFSSTAIGVAQAVRGPQVFRVKIPIENLPPEFIGYQIAQVSDLHVGPIIEKRYVENVVRITNDLNADLIALTGDFVDGSVDRLSIDVEPLGKLKSKDGIFFTTGNHEYYWGVERWLEKFRSLGIDVLINEHRVIQKNGKNLVIAGTTDQQGSRFSDQHQYDPEKALFGAPTIAPKILLHHRPDGYEKAEALGFDLQISGHTHGGQFFPWSLFMPLAHRYYRGLSKHGRMWIYVNRGTGFWGPPIRFGINPEITLYELSKA